LHGAVLDVSQDAIDQRKPPADPGNMTKPNTDSASEPQGHELVYAAHVSLDRSAMEIDGKDVPLSPGMAVTVEIKTGAQRVITYLMSPLLRFKQEALHER
jgi:hemolysin D